MSKNRPVKNSQSGCASVSVRAIALKLSLIITAWTLTVSEPLTVTAQNKPVEIQTNNLNSSKSAHDVTPNGKPVSVKQSVQAAGRGNAEDLMLRIMRAEDERRWDEELSSLLFDKKARVRRRAALAAGRIGDARAVAHIIALLQTDRDPSVRSMAAFALGEVESATSTDALLAALQRKKESSEVRARVIEAMGKIAAALPKTDEARSRALGEAILNTLASEAQRSPKPDRELILRGLTAALRARPANAGPEIAKFLSSADARIRADAANALARLRAKDGGDQLRSLLLNDADPTVRANAARALGAGEDQSSLDALLARGVNDPDERVRVSAIRALGALKDGRIAESLLQRAQTLSAAYRAAKANGVAHPPETNEILEIATTLGRVLVNTSEARAIAWLRELREAGEGALTEVEVAFARIAPATYLREKPLGKLSDQAVRARLQKDWRQVSSIVQGLGEISGITAAAAGNAAIGLQADAQIILRSLLDDAAVPALAVPDLLRALAAFKPGDLGELLRKQLSASDVIVRATAAELLGELAPDEAHARALAEALPVSMRDEMNDATLSILDSLAKQKSASANDAIKKALDSPDHLVRRRAAALLKANGAGDFSARTGTVATRNATADYQRALERGDKRVRAVVATDKGSFVIELLPDEAALTVDNFVQLTQRGFFNGITFHRVVPNFVIQGGDPRGDGNGGPGYQIRCEINEVPYERGAVGMALSGKDTGGSQWFVTHAPQPHLDGGYTVFGQVVEGMEVVDRIARGDVIRSISVTVGARSKSKGGARSTSRSGKENR